MPITRKFVAQDQDDNQVLRMGASKRFIVVKSDDWQFLFGPNSIPEKKIIVPKVAAEFDSETFSKIRLTGYLYSTLGGTIESAASCSFAVSKVGGPGWIDSPLASYVGVVQPNAYFYAEIPLSSFPSVEFQGETTIMIEVVLTRLGTQYRDRLYVNHLGIYDNCFRLKQKIDYLDVMKLDE